MPIPRDAVNMERPMAIATKQKRNFITRVKSLPQFERVLCNDADEKYFRKFVRLGVQGSIFYFGGEL